MSIESIYRNQISAESVERHEEKLNEKLELTQLIYADDQYKLQLEREDNFEIKEEKGIKFSDILERDTAIGANLSSEYEKRKKDESPDKEVFLENIKEKINLIYQKRMDSWKEEVVECIKIECDKLGERRKEKTEDKNEVGIIHYVFRKNNENFLKYGIGGVEDFIEIHLDKVYKKNDQDFSVTELKNSLGKLASLIIKECPTVKNIVARSWLIDNDLAKRLGFEILERNPSLTHSSTWWQFIDKRGQIDKNRFEKFMKTGQLPFEVALGKIEVEDFLKRFLPKNERGEISLKELLPEAKKRAENLSQFGKKFVEKFDSVSVEEMIEMFSENEIFSALRKEGQLDELITFLSQMKNKGYSWKKIENDKGQKLRAISEKLKDKIEFSEYVDKKIYIE